MSFLGVVPNVSILPAPSSKILAEKITCMYALPTEVREKHVLDARNVVVEKHSLEKLAVQLHAYLTEHV